MIHHERVHHTVARFELEAEFLYGTVNGQ